MTIAIIGAGLAGLSCAARLVAAGHTARLFDKGRGPGGRMATRRMDTRHMDTPGGQASFDHGAQYLTARDPAFRAQVQAWAGAGLAALWPAAGPEAWVGTPAMNAPLKHMAAALDVQWSAQVTAIRRDAAGWHLAGDGIATRAFDALVVAIPAEQAGPLLASLAPGWSTLAAATPAEPCWTVMAAFDAGVDAPDILRADGPIGWAARNSAKPGRTGPEAWVIQAGPDWSRQNLERRPEQVLPDLLAAFAARVGPLPPTIAAAAHRWRYARSGRAGAGALWDPALRLGVCGDWLLGPRVECAWLSGQALAAQIGSTPSG